jgi:hypothetical protein
MAWDITPSPEIQTDAPAGRDSLLHVAALRLEVVACIPRLRHNRPFEFGWGMGACTVRTVFIVHDRASQRSWVAVDRFSGAPLLRLHNYDQLQGVCSRLGWAIVREAATTAQPSTRPARRLTRTRRGKNPRRAGLGVTPNYAHEQVPLTE